MSIEVSDDILVRYSNTILGIDMIDRNTGIYYSMLEVEKDGYNKL